jgi:hypothetical protein
MSLMQLAEREKEKTRRESNERNVDKAEKLIVREWSPDDAICRDQHK